MAVIVDAVPGQNVPFTMVPNSILRGEAGLSDRAIAILCEIMSHTSGFAIRQTDLERPGRGRDATSVAVNELIEKGYVVRAQERTEGGTFARSVWIRSWTPLSEEDRKSFLDDDGFYVPKPPAEDPEDFVLEPPEDLEEHRSRVFRDRCSRDRVSRDRKTRAYKKTKDQENQKQRKPASSTKGEGAEKGTINTTRFDSMLEIEDPSLFFQEFSTMIGFSIPPGSVMATVQQIPSRMPDEFRDRWRDYVLQRGAELAGHVTERQFVSYLIRDAAEWRPDSKRPSKGPKAKISKDDSLDFLDGLED